MILQFLVQEVSRRREVAELQQLLQFKEALLADLQRERELRSRRTAAAQDLVRCFKVSFTVYQCRAFLYTFNSFVQRMRQRTFQLMYIQESKVCCITSWTILGCFCAGLERSIPQLAKFHLSNDTLLECAQTVFQALIPACVIIDYLCTCKISFGRAWYHK